MLVSRLQSLKTYIYARKLTFVAFLSTVCVFLILIFRAGADTRILQQTYTINPLTLQIFYLALSIFLFVAFILEIQIRREFTYAPALVIFMAGLASFLIVGLYIPNELDRLLIRGPFTIWLIIAHVVLMAGLMAGLAIDHPATIPSQRLLNYSTLVAVGFGLMLLALYVLSIGRYTQLDTPDEAELSTLAVSYARHGILDRTYIASAYGVPDPVAARYYLVMGLWLRLAGTSFVAMRAFPVITAVVALILVAIVLWAIPSATWLQRFAGLAYMLASTPFFRASHNIRQDIGLAVYSALLLLAFVFYNQNKRKFWVFLGGLALFVGLETIPIPSLIFGGFVGIAFAREALRQPNNKRHWLTVVLYLLGTAIALVAYGTIRLIPNPAENWGNFINYYNYYQSLGILQGRQANAAIDYPVSFSLILSPVELFTIIGLFILAVTKLETQERWLVVSCFVAIIVIALRIQGIYNYIALIAPLVAYVVARLFQTKAMITIGVFVLLPALMSAPIRDMLFDIQANYSQREIQEADLLTWQIPEGTTLVGEDIFWFTLNKNRRFIGWNGLKVFADAHQLTEQEALDMLNVTYLICFQDYQQHCELGKSSKFAPPIDFVITRGKYLLYQRLP